MTLEKAFGQYLCSLRNSYSLTQEELALKAGIECSEYQALEYGSELATIKTLSAIAKAFDIRASVLIAGAERLCGL